MGIKFDAKEISLSSSLEVKDEKNEIIGELRSACYSPHFQKVIGIAMMKKPFTGMYPNLVKIEINEQYYLTEKFAIYLSSSIKVKEYHEYSNCRSDR